MDTTDPIKLRCWRNIFFLEISLVSVKCFEKFPYASSWTRVVGRSSDLLRWSTTLIEILDVEVNSKRIVRSGVFGTKLAQKKCHLARKCLNPRAQSHSKRHTEGYETFSIYSWRLPRERNQDIPPCKGYYPLQDRFWSEAEAKGCIFSRNHQLAFSEDHTDLAKVSSLCLD